MLKDEKQIVEEGLVIKEKQIYVLEDELRKKIIYLHYDTLVGEYGRRWKITELVTRNYWWSGATKKMKRYVERCNAC